MRVRIGLKEFDDQYFVGRVAVSSTNCWEWQLRKDEDGYGRAKSLAAHRVAYEVFVGAIPKGMWVLHTCDNPSCVNPDHLWIGTAKDNSVDMARKGRSFIPSTEQARKAQEAAMRVIRAKMS